MVSAIDATKPADAVVAAKADLRANLAAAKSEIEALQSSVAAIPSSVPGARNRVLNGNMRIDRRALGTLSVTPTNKGFYLDRWQVGSEVAAGATVAATTVAGTGNRTAMQLQITAAKTPAAGDRTWVGQPIESATMFDLQWGSASAQSLVLSFWVRSSVAGVFSVAMQNVGFTRSRVQTYTVNIANVWEFKTVVFTGDTAGAWATGTTTAWALRFDLGSGSTYTGTAGVWTASDIRTATGAVALSATLNATLQLSDVQLEAGTVVSTFERRPDTWETILTGRYYETGQFNMAGYQLIGQPIQYFIPAQVQKRAAPTITAPGATSNVSGATFNPGVNGFLATGTATGSGTWTWPSSFVMDAELTL